MVLNIHEFDQKVGKDYKNSFLILNPQQKNSYNAQRGIFFHPKFFSKCVFANFRKSQKKSVHYMRSFGNGIKF